MSDRLELLPKHDSHHGYGAGREFPRHKSELVLGNSHLFDDIPKSKKKVNSGNQDENEELISLSAANGNVTLPKSYLESGGHFPAKDAYINTLKTQFYSLGLCSGAALQMFIVSFVIMFVSTSNNAGPIQELSHEYYAVFRGVFLISFFFCLYGANLFIWRRMKIDYSHILGVSYAHTYQYVLRGSSTVAYVTCTSFLLFIMTITGGLDSFGNKNVLKHVWPALTVFLPIILFVCPIDWLTQGCFGVTRHGFQQRYSLLKELAAIVCSPFSDVTFFRSFVADVLTSMPKVFPDLQYTLCLYSTMSFFCDREENWRIPHANNRQVFNAIKYLLSMSVTALAKARTSFDPLMNEKLGNVWVGLGVVATLYSVYWDVCIDWGLGSLRSQNLLLRDSLHFAPSTYYIAIALNFVMRLGWALIISPDQPYLQQHYILVLGAVELLRRFQWAIFRVEWEHTQHWEKANKPTNAAVSTGPRPGARLYAATDEGHRHRELHKGPSASASASARHACNPLHHETNGALRHDFHSSESLSDRRHLDQDLFFEETVELEVMHAEGELLTDDRDESGDARAVFSRGRGLGVGVGSARQETEPTDRDSSDLLA